LPDICRAPRFADTFVLKGGATKRLLNFFSRRPELGASDE